MTSKSVKESILNVANTEVKNPIDHVMDHPYFLLFNALIIDRYPPLRWRIVEETLNG